MKISCLFSKPAKRFFCAAIVFFGACNLASCDSEPLQFITVDEAELTTGVEGDVVPADFAENVTPAAGISDPGISDQAIPDPGIPESQSSVADDPTLFGNPATITDVVLVTGQSNALGIDNDYDIHLDAPHPRAYAFTEHGWRIADLHQIWDLDWHSRDPEEDPTNNFGFHFARKVAARRDDRVVGIVLVTLPGAGITEWDYESELYVKIRNRVVDALNELPSKATIDGVLWHQGETDWTDSEFYSTRLYDLIGNFRGESWFGEERPFICGETVSAPLNNSLMALNTDGDSWTGCVEGENLPTVIDEFHFSSEALRIIGTRYATKYLQMTEQSK